MDLKMNLNILAAEDKLRHYNNLVAVLDTITPSDKALWGIGDLEFTHAASAEQAMEHLGMAAKRRRPFDMLVLDLGLPLKEGDKDEDQDNGFDVLRVAHELGAAKQTIIFTVYAGDHNILRALREGACDFVKKPDGPDYDQQELKTRFMSCWQRIVETSSAGLFEQRIKDLVPYAEAGLAQRFEACFTDILQKVAHTAEDIERYAYERFGIDSEKDPQDYLIRLLNNQNANLKAARENWAGLNADLLGYDGKGTAMTLGTLLDSVREKLSPCLLVKKTTLRQDLSGAGLAALLSFQNDVRVIVQEVITGALSTLPDYGTPRTLDVAALISEGQAEIRFTDNLEPISPMDAQAINSGSVVGPDHGPAQFGRVWGLSVAQHIALRGGGRLIVKARQNEPGNVVTYFAPLAQFGDDRMSSRMAEFAEATM